MDSLQQRLYTAIAAWPILDPHSHIDPPAPVAKSLDDILAYHYYTELAHSCGLDKAVLGPSVPARDRARSMARYLPAFDNTVLHAWLLDIARTFFGFEHESICSSNIDELFDRAAEACGAADWEQQVLQRSGIEQVFLTNEFDDPLDGFDTGRYVPTLRTDDLVFRLGEAQTLQRLQAAVDMEVGDGDTLVEALGRLFERFRARGARACAISLPPDFEPAAVDRHAVGPAVQAVLGGRAVRQDDLRAVQRFVFWSLAAFCAQFGWPFDLMIGPVRKVYRAGVFQGQDLFDQRTSLYQYRELFNAFPQVTFAVSVVSSNQNQELVSYAWLFPNVVTSGHWWYSNVPAYIEPDLRARLTAVPAVKQIGYYSDAYKLEFVLPKFNMYRRVLAKVLAEEFVVGRGWSEERALDLAKALLRDNPRRIFGLDT